MTDGLLMPSHLMILALVALVLFGPKRLPEIGRSLGTAMRSFRDELSSDHTAPLPPETGVNGDPAPPRTQPELDA